LVVPVLPLVLPPMPLLPLAPPLELPGRGAGCAGVVGVVVELPPIEPVEPEAPEPALERFSRTHFSCSAPIRPMHLAGVAPEAPALEPPLVLVSALPLVLGLVLEPLLPPMVELPELPPAAAPPPTLEPDEAPVEPEVDEPELCARVAVESARSAAAVAAVSVFNIMSCSPGDDWLDCRRQARKPCARPHARVHYANAL
jgi:hypothetical protein